ncbi:MAG: ATP-binding cassette domain-containing protein [Desulfurococcales archaeon]|nr:ATP-binding cassette domain-containing protein [Desulfurococcales archaeon]
MLELRSISKRFGGVIALDNISLKVDKELVGIVGPNGSGKTTLFNVITGHVKHDQGRLIFMGRDISRLSIGERVRIGILRTFQSPKVFWSLSVEDNIAPLTRNKAHVEEVLKMLDLWERRKAMPTRLGLSYVRRLEIARCLVLDPKLLLLDEPLAGLSSVEASELGSLIEEIHRKLGIGVIVIEHKISHLSSFAKRIIAMNSGRVVIDAPAEDAIRKVRDMLLSI